MDFFAHHILSVVLFTPLAGALLLLFIPRDMETAHRIAGNVFGVLGFLVSLPLLRWFNLNWGGFAFEESAEWIPSIGAKYHLGIDGISFLLVLLTTLLGMIAILSSWSAIHQRTKEYYILLLLLQTGMTGVCTRPSSFSCTPWLDRWSCCWRSWRFTFMRRSRRATRVRLTCRPCWPL